MDDFVTSALLPLAAAIACDIWVALYKLYGAGVIPQMGALLAASLLLGLWYCLPLILRRAQRLPKAGRQR